MRAMRATRTFHLVRHVDTTGVSGTGVVAEGVEFTDGTCVMKWHSQYSSTIIYDQVEDLLAIHGHGGASEIVWTS